MIVRLRETLQVSCMYVNLLCRCVRTGGRLIVVGCPCLSTGRNKMWVRRSILGTCSPQACVLKGWLLLRDDGIFKRQSLPESL